VRHRRELLDGLLAQARSSASRLLHASSAWQRALAGPAPDRLLATPRSFWPKSPAEAELLIMGRFRLNGGEATARDGSPFFISPPSEAWAESLHAFHWLRHFDAGGSEPFQEHLRQLIAHWLRNYGDWHELSWRPHVIARRLMTWTSFGRLVLANAEILFRSRVLLSMARQARHLARTAHLAPAGMPRLTAAIGLAQSGVCLPDGEARMNRGLHLLARELSTQILPDGGHVSRNPEALLEAASDLLSLVDAMTQRQLLVPVTIRRALDRMMPMIRLLRHQDGRLALFNGASEGPDGWAETILAQDLARHRTAQQAPQSGYQRVECADALLIADAGLPPPAEVSTEAQAGTLSFEFGAAGERLIVNCGTSRIKGGEWQEAMRATAAHSTLAISDASSAHVVPSGWARTLLGPQLVDGPTDVRCRRRETEEGISLALSHDGYARLGFRHERVLHLSHDGKELNGEDALVQAPDHYILPFVIRFHLHPAIRILRAGDGLILATPGGTIWRFTTDAAIEVAESVYLGHAAQVRKTQQVILTEAPGHHTGKVKWSLRRTGGGEPPETSVN
ncbi:MAG: heparinase II/III family protein, partial [Alphaproteobacteria bacterium]